MSENPGKQLVKTNERISSVGQIVRSIDAADAEALEMTLAGMLATLPAGKDREIALGVVQKVQAFRAYQRILLAVQSDMEARIAGLARREAGSQRSQPQHPRFGNLGKL